MLEKKKKRNSCGEHAKWEDSQAAPKLCGRLVRYEQCDNLAAPLTSCHGQLL